MMSQRTYSSSKRNKTNWFPIPLIHCRFLKNQAKISVKLLDVPKWSFWTVATDSITSKIIRHQSNQEKPILIMNRNSTWISLALVSVGLLLTKELVDRIRKNLRISWMISALVRSRSIRLTKISSENVSVFAFFYVIYNCS